jgi:hypothetical protein
MFLKVVICAARLHRFWQMIINGIVKVTLNLYAAQQSVHLTLAPTALAKVNL